MCILPSAFLYFSFFSFSFLFTNSCCSYYLLLQLPPASSASAASCHMLTACDILTEQQVAKWHGWRLTRVTMEDMNTIIWTKVSKLTNRVSLRVQKNLEDSKLILNCVGISGVFFYNRITKIDWRKLVELCISFYIV